MTGRTHQGTGESVTGIFDVSDDLFFREISRPMLPETLKPTVTCYSAAVTADSTVELAEVRTSVLSASIIVSMTDTRFFLSTGRAS